MTEPTRGLRQRRSYRRPGWPLLTALLVLAIVASSILVFTNKVELLKLAVVIALWAAVVSAFISFIYRRQADVDQARARDLKLVYDLQLDREILARREYELSVESQLRRELTSELQAQASDEVANLRAELAALRANLELLFDTDLQHRPALETDRTAVHAFGRVISSRIDAEDTEDSEDVDPVTEESPIIDVPEEPHPPEHEWSSPPVPVGAHRRPSERDPAETAWRPAEPPTPPQSAPPPPTQSDEPRWQPAPAEGQFIPAGEPGSNWTAPPPTEPNPVSPAMVPPPTESQRGRHATYFANGDAPLRGVRQSTGEAVDPVRAAPTLAAPAQPPVPPPPPAAPPSARHRGGDESGEDAGADESGGQERSDSGSDTGQHAGGQPVSELLARLQVSSTGGGRRRRRED
jgi:hypothetical protein